MSDFVFGIDTIDTSIPIVTVVFTINNLIYETSDPLTDITATVDVVSTSPVIDETGAFLYGWPRSAVTSSANQITVIPLPATKDVSGNGNHITTLDGSDVHYTLTVAGTSNGSPVNLVTRYPFNVDAATTNGTLFSELTATP